MIILSIILTITGMILSIDIFNFIQASNYDFYYNIHVYGADIEILIMFIHLSLHLKEVLRKLKIKNPSTIIPIIIFVLMITATYFIYRDMFKSNQYQYQNTDNSNGSDNSSDSTKTDNLDNTDNTTNDDEIKETETDVVETLKEYLSKLHCDGCGRHCLLSAPQCSKSEPYIEAATADYYEKYNLTETANGISYNYEGYTIDILL
ncbi:MAG: hypothetical protein PHD02_00700 [Bacilli bacterium]|nr:hypothetical protein [Bacilli bacterium]